MPKVSSERLPSGMGLVVVRARAALLASISLQVDAGGLADRPGVAELTGQMVELGAGTTNAKLGEHERAVALVGGELRMHHSPHGTRFELLVPHDRVAAGLGMMGGLFARSHLRQAGFRALRGRAMALADARSRDDAGWVGRELSRRSLFGGSATSRAATDGTVAELARIRHAHCDTFYTQHYRPEHSELTVVADMSRASLRALVDKHFKPLAERKGVAEDAARTAKIASTGTSAYLVHQHGAIRSEVVIGVAIDTAAALSAKLLAARLVAQRVREALALPADDVRVAIESSGAGQAFRIAFSAQVGHTAASLSLVKDALNKLRGSGAVALAGAVDGSRRALLLELATELERVDAIARRVAMLRAWKLSNEAVAQYPSQLQSVRALAVMTVLRSMSSARTLVVVGDADTLQPTLGPERFERVDPRSGFSTERPPKRR